VGIAPAPDGSLFVTDWVDKSYTLHGKGRIWRIRAAQPPRRVLPSDDREAPGHADRLIRESAARRLAGAGAAGLADLRRVACDHTDARARALALETLSNTHESPDCALRDRSAEVRALAVRILPSPPVDASTVAETDPAVSVRSEALRRIDGRAGRPLLLKALVDLDPFLAQAAREGLKRSASLADLLELARSAAPENRLGALLVLRDSPEPDARGVLAALLADPDPAVRRAAIQWAGEQGLAEFRAPIEAELGSPAGTRETFEAALAALERLDGIVRKPKEEVSGQDYVAALLLSPQVAPAARRRALRVLRPDHPVLTLARYREFLHSDDPGIALEAVRSLRESPYRARFALLSGLARDASRPVALRAEAVAGLAGDEPAQRELLVALATEADPVMRRTALRSLRGAGLSAAERQCLSGRAQHDAADAELVASVLNPGPSPEEAPERSLNAWLEVLQGPADPAEGERVFFHPKGPGCYRCHAVDGRGGVAGPDLAAAGRALRRDKLVESIVNPSKEVAPLFVAWTVARTDGTVFDGLLIDETAEGVQTYVNRQGEVVTLPKSQVEERRPSPTSIMPENLARTMTRREFRDLIAYLRQPK
jgi:putative heme-binding domain-containing protein